jgi:hypothetical protein
MLLLAILIGVDNATCPEIPGTQTLLPPPSRQLRALPDPLLLLFVHASHVYRTGVPAGVGVGVGPDGVFVAVGVAVAVGVGVGVGTEAESKTTAETFPCVVAGMPVPAFMHEKLSLSPTTKSSVFVGSVSKLSAPKRVVTPFPFAVFFLVLNT